MQTVGLRLFDNLGGLLLFQQTDGVVPAAGLAAIFERCLCCPRQVWRIVGRFFRVLAGGFVCAETSGLQVKAAQAKLPRLRIVGHRFELGACLVVAAFDERRLCFQKIDQRFLIGADKTARAGRHLAGEQGIAGAGSNEAGRQCLITAVAFTGAKEARHRMRRGPYQADEPPGHHE